MKNQAGHTADHVVFLGEAGFPLGLAAIQRLTLLAKSLTMAGCEVLVISRKGVHDPNHKALHDIRGIHEGIHFVYTTDSVYRPNKFLKRNIQKVKGLYYEYTLLRSLKRKNKLDLAVLSTMSSFHAFRYRLISRMIGFPLVLNLVELASSIPHRSSLSQKINDFLYDNYVIRNVDAALPISDFLLERFKNYSPYKPVFKIPILCDFEEFEVSAQRGANIHFLYLGAASYTELISFVIDAFDHLGNIPDNVHLNFIVGGKDDAIQNVKNLINRSRNTEKIKLFHNIPREDIPGHLAKASALLIPLRPTVQDKARFPHKIGEYLASGTPMITTAYGEINSYEFKDLHTALVADTFNLDAVAHKMQFVVDHPDQAIKIGLRGRQFGLKNFDYRLFGDKMRLFFSNLMDERTGVSDINEPNKGNRK